jgi:hypothetical protein
MKETCVKEIKAVNAHNKQTIRGYIFKPPLSGGGLEGAGIGKVKNQTSPHPSFLRRGLINISLPVIGILGGYINLRNLFIKFLRSVSETEGCANAHQSYVM